MLKSISFQDLRHKAAVALDKRVRAITAGLGLNELRNVMRGDPPQEKPNPRYKVHTTSFLFSKPAPLPRSSTVSSGFSAAMNLGASLGAVTVEGGEVFVGSRLTVYRGDEEAWRVQFPLLLLAVIGSTDAVVGAIGQALSQTEAKPAESAWQARDFEGSLLATGVATVFAMHCIINVGMTTGILPVVGIPLPLVSYGGSSLLTLMLAVALVINVNMRRFLF